ncbi:hypothetical protein A2V71_02075 [Candidatus Berkelbacteria bacterium RBG_13_40_8]|uniref:Uncharacterized protein n=1 Tax=Candidatus Berkelbacteria bacterium RBG_13_40_8 TaxID=1797467 RepID=A0A1F5DQ71_9BACT|nr:MAG: hypothetical protein A2V71_02075 [Candidatus Berkelbacteria bacterium RBG_13_40_8]
MPEAPSEHPFDKPQGESKYPWDSLPFKKRITCGYCGTFHNGNNDSKNTNGYRVAIIEGRKLVMECCGSILDKDYEKFGYFFCKIMLNKLLEDPLSNLVIAQKVREVATKLKKDKLNPNIVINPAGPLTNKRSFDKFGEIFCLEKLHLVMKNPYRDLETFAHLRKVFSILRTKYIDIVNQADPKLEKSPDEQIVD